MESDRNIAEVGRKTGVDEQNMQHFMSQSPWSARAMIEQMQSEVMNRQELMGGVLILDESADAKSGEMSAGAARQHNGRLGKVDVCQVGVFLTYAKDGIWTWLDGELFLPEKWLSDDYAARRTQVGIPTDRSFQTKIELGWQMIERAQKMGFLFEAVAFDSLYGRNRKLRDQCQANGIEYYADVPCNQKVYLTLPELVYPLTKQNRPAKYPQVVGQVPVTVQSLAENRQTHWRSLVLRPSERGMLEAEFARQQVWTVDKDGTIRQETLVIRRDPNRLTYSLTNAPTDTPLLTLAQRKTQRYFVERSIQDAKAELGWDEFQAIKFRAWEHQLALTLLASWFIAETQLDWRAEHPQDPTLIQDYETDVLPRLSMANVRELLRATLPLPHLSAEQATLLVVKHLDNRTRSRRSRLKKHSGP
jgi:SRSO17 transposase